MTKKVLVRRAGRLINRRTLRLLTVLGTVLAVCTAVMSALGALLMVRQLQLISAQKKTLPVLRSAAEVYLEKNAPERLPRKKRFFLPAAKNDRFVIRLGKKGAAPAEEPENPPGEQGEESE